jgi:hypothetical protein
MTRNGSISKRLHTERFHAGWSLRTDWTCHSIQLNHHGVCSNCLRRLQSCWSVLNRRNRVQRPVGGSLSVQRRLNAVCGSTANRSAECSAETDSCLISMEELIRVLLQQAGRAEKPYSSCGDVIGGQLERAEHSAAVEERAGDVPDAFDLNAIGKPAKMSCRRLIQRPDEVTPRV